MSRIGMISGLGIRPNIIMRDFLPGYLMDKFLLLWLKKYSGENLQSDLGDDVITVNGKDWITTRIPDTDATFSVPENATFLAADGSDEFWFDGEGNLQQKTFTQLIESTTLRTFVKYTDFEPYEISAIGILKADAVLTENDIILVTRAFKLWAQYWGLELMEQGYMKDNRILLED